MQTTLSERSPRPRRGTAYLPGLRREREAKGLSIRGLAKKAELDFTTVWQLEMLNKAARQTTRRKLAYALGVGIKDLKRRAETKDEAET